MKSFGVANGDAYNEDDEVRADVRVGSNSDGRMNYIEFSTFVYSPTFHSDSF